MVRQGQVKVHAAMTLKSNKAIRAPLSHSGKSWGVKRSNISAFERVSDVLSNYPVLLQSINGAGQLE